MELKSELKYPYTEDERSHFIVEQNHTNGYEIREVKRIEEYQEKVFEFEEVEEKQPLAFDEETNEPIDFETIMTKKPVMITVQEKIETQIFDEETGEITASETKTIEKQEQKFHYETREKEVTDLQAWGYTREEIEQQKQEQFKKDFFETSLGWVRRTVTMQNGVQRDFLFDILPNLEAGVPIITYNIDGTQNRDMFVTSDFIAQCKQQILKDFYGV